MKCLTVNFSFFNVPRPGGWDRQPKSPDCISEFSELSFIISPSSEDFNIHVSCPDSVYAPSLISQIDKHTHGKGHTLLLD